MSAYESNSKSTKKARLYRTSFFCDFGDLEVGVKDFRMSARFVSTSAVRGMECLLIPSHDTVRNDTHENAKHPNAPPMNRPGRNREEPTGNRSG